MQIPPLDRNPIEWANTQGANLYSTGASGPAAVRPIHAVNAVESVDKLGEGVTVSIKNPDKPTDKSEQDLDWTAKKELQEKSLKEIEEEKNKEPLSKQLIEFIQSMWRASAMAVEAAEQAQKTDQQERNMLQVRTEPLTYEEPKVKRTGGL
ncbi:Uncharacterised protein [uncultured Comamonas sp.]|nr:Uncharacterised protein [uncultured Comamonas sp.]